MTRTLIKNVDVITLDDTGSVMTGIDVAVDGDRIAAVGHVPVDFQADDVLNASSQESQIHRGILLQCACEICVEAVLPTM